MRVPKKSHRNEIIDALLQVFSEPRRITEGINDPRLAKYEEYDVLALLRALRFVGVISDMSGYRRNMIVQDSPDRLEELGHYFLRLASEVREKGGSLDNAGEDLDLSPFLDDDNDDDGLD